MAVPAIIAALIAKEGIKAAIKKFGKKAVKEATDTPKNKLSNKSKAEMAAAGTAVAGSTGLIVEEIKKADKKKKEVKSKKPKGKELSAIPLLESTQRRINYERAQKAKNNKEPEKKAMGGMMKKKGYAKGGAVRKQSKPRGVGAAKRGFGKEMR